MKNFFALLLFLLLYINVSAQETTTSEQDDLAFELCQLFAIDQAIRNPEYSNVLKERIIKIDSLNFDKFIAFVSKNGFPAEKLVGEKNWMQGCVRSVGFLYLVHNPNKIVTKYYEFFKAEVDKGNLTPMMFSYALDRYHVSTEGRSYYDTPYKAWTSATGVCLQDKAKSDSLRTSIGLEPLQEFVDCTEIEISDKPNYSNPINLTIPD